MPSERRVAVVAVLVLAPVGAELLAAYDSSTGRPVELVFSVAVFALLYGCPALLIREVARRTDSGWRAILLLGAAAGLLQAGVIDQSLFADHYNDVRGWERTLHATYIAPLGVGGYFLQNFVVGHVVYSFGAPLAVAEGLAPRIAERPWLTRRGIVLATLGWLLVAGAVLGETLGGDDHGTTLEVGVTLGVVAALVVVALRPRRRSVRVRARACVATTPTPALAATVAFVLASLHALLPETWPGVAGAVVVLAGSAVLLIRASTTSGWGTAHVAAVGAGVLVSRGVLAFTYFPVVGHTPALAKYAHNAVMLAVVATLGFLAVRRAEDHARGLKA